MVASQSIAQSQPRVDVGARVGHHVRGGVGDAVEGSGGALRKVAWRREAEVFERAVGVGRRMVVLIGMLLHRVERGKAAGGYAPALVRDGRPCGPAPLRYSVSWPVAKLASLTSRARAARVKSAGPSQRVGRQRAVGGAQGDLHAVIRLSAGTSIQRRSFQLCSAHSTSCTPLAPSSRVHLKGASSTTWRMKASHWILKPLS